MNFDELRERIEQHAHGCWDAILTSRDLRVLDTDFIQLGGEEIGHPTDWALSQLLSRLEIEQRPFFKMVTYPRRHEHGGQVDQQLFTTILNTRLQHYSHLRWFVRMRETESCQLIRAFLSDKFRPFDHRPFISALLDPKTQIEKVAQIRSFALGPQAEDLYLKLLFPELTRKIGDEVYKVGVIYFNGELGNRSVGMSPFIYRQACLNDLVLVEEESFRQRHIGRLDQNILTAIFASRTVELLEKALVDVQRLEALRRVEIPDLEAEINRLKQEFGLTKGQAEGIKFFTQEEALGEDISAFHLVNGVTRFARLQQTIDERVRFEEFGGRLLERYYSVN